MRVVGYEPLAGDGELPMRVHVEAAGPAWDRRYSESIVVDLDGQTAVVSVSLTTVATAERLPSKASAGRAEAARQRRRQPNEAREPQYRSPPSRVLVRLIDGATSGLRWGAVAGAVILGIVGVLNSVNSGYPAATLLFMTPGMAVLLGVPGAIVVGIVGAVLGGLALSGVAFVSNRWREKGPPHSSAPS